MHGTGSVSLSRAVASAALALALAVALAPAPAAAAGKLKVGLMLPYSGTYAALGNAITNGFKLYVQESGGRLGGREVEFFTVDDESDPAKAPDNASKLIKRDQVDVLVGTVHSGVALAMAKVARDTNTLLVVPNAGAGDLTGPLCAPNVFRTSFTMWQSGYAMGKVAAEQKKKTAVTFTWKYAGGEESVAGFREAYEASGGKILKALTIPFPQVEFQSYLTEIASLKPEVVYVFFAGGGAVKFVKDYAAAGLKTSIPLYGAGFLTTLHYADGLQNPKDKAFRKAYAAAYKAEADVYAMQGYDSAQLLAAGLRAVNGDTSRRADLVKAMEAARIDSPRGSMTLSRAHNPVNDIYLRRVEGKENKVVGVAAPALADPARGCRM